MDDENKICWDCQNCDDLGYCHEADVHCVWIELKENKCECFIEKEEE